MNANLKSIVGAAVATLALAMVACGKSGGNNNNNGTNGVNCIQVGSTCVATAPGYISSGTWRGQLYNSATGPVDISIQLSPNGGGGYGGGYGGYPGMPGYGTGVGVAAVQTIATVTIRTQTTVIQGTGVANGSVSGFNTVIQAQTPYGVQQLSVNGSFVDASQRGMNVSVNGTINVNGIITGNPNNQGAVGGGYGYGGGNLNGGYGYGNGGYGYGYGAGYGYTDGWF